MIQSTFGDDSKYPSNRCAFFWLFALSIIVAPFAYISHLCNRFISMMSDYLNAFWGLAMVFIGGLMCAAGLSSLTEHGYAELHWYHALPKLTKVGICYLGALPSIVLLLIALGILIFAVGGIMWLFYTAGTYLWEAAGSGLSKTDDTLVSGYFKDLKKRHCTQIEYVRKPYNPAPVNSASHELDND